MSGRINLYDVETNQMVRYFDHAHVGRVGSISWNDAVLGTGGKDKCVREHDTRVGGRSAQIRCISFHKQEVCGLKYSFEGGSSQRMLASGGNDNKLAIWDARYVDSGAPPGEVIPLHKFSAHTAAVKAIAWSPHFTGVLASGGGTADRCIKVWSTQTGTMLSSMDTGSQVCGLVFSKSVQELVSTHGYSLNQICIWRAQNPKVHLHKIGTLQGHTLRVLYLGLSPDGSTIVTGAGDESLRFWSVWPGRSEGTSGSATRFTEMNLLDGVPGAYLR
jgi:cell division cycle 20-like protein 1 (cofactor of APC complex)